jgi:hypothetical protein
MSKKLKTILEIAAEVFGIIVATLPIIRIFRRKK